MAIHHWRGHTIEVELQPFGVFLWLMAGFVVKVDGRRFIPDFDHAGFKTRTNFTIEDESKRYSGLVKSIGVPVFLPRLRYSVTVDGEEIGIGEEFLKRWYLSCLVFGLLMIILNLACCGAIGLFYLVRGS